MKKSIALLFAGALVTGFAFAGGIENKTNMSTGYLRNPSRNVEAARPEASFYNIAGTGFMENGLHIEVGDQFIIKEYANTLDTTAGSISKGTKYNDETFVWLYPNIDVVYKMDKWAFFGNFGIYAGGGKLEYSEGTSVTALAFLGQASTYSEQAKMAEAAATTYAAVDASKAAEYSKKAQADGNAAKNLLAASGNHSLTINSITYGEQIGVAYNLFDIVSLSAAIRFLQGDQKLTLESAYFNAISGQGNEVGCKSFAFGVSPVFGAHVRLFEKLDIAAQLQVKTVMKYKVNEVTGKTIADQIGVTEDKEFHSDLPTALNLGVGYRVIEPLYISTSFNYYFNKSADCDTVIGTSSYDDSFEIAAGADYTINDFVLVSAGLAYGKQGTTSTANNVFNPILDSFQIGFGAEIKPIKILTITAGGTWVKYFDTTYTKSGYDIDLSKKLFMFSLGATLKLF